jgi:hypothetical protein
MIPLIVFLLATVHIALAQQQGPPRFRSTADAVRVDIQVLDKGKPVAGLVASAFELRDGSVAQNIQTIAVEDVPVSLILALDTSESVAGRCWNS